MRHSYRSRRPQFGRKRFTKKRTTNLDVVSAIRASVQKTHSTSAVQPRVEIKHTFADFAISDVLKRNIETKGYTAPTPIQDQAIPYIVDGRDLIGIANTGTGKTAAFLIPIIDKLTKDKNQRVLIVTPTRELAVQICDELRDLSGGLGLRWALLIGGANSWRQRRDINNGARVVIGTPGRLRDFIEHKQLRLSQFRTVVLDEADRMVDIGFIREIQYFISLLPEERQSLFFSATISGKVSTILQAFVRNPVTVSVKQSDAARSVEQRIIETDGQKKKVDQLHDLLIRDEFEKVLVFGRTKFGVEKLAKELLARGFKAGAIHGNKRQNQRQRTLQQFRHDEINILLATDVASRGLDIDNVSHVINFDVPETFEDYIHRIGRTGRGNKSGVAYTFAG